MSREILKGDTRSKKYIVSGRTYRPVNLDGDRAAKWGKGQYNFGSVDRLMRERPQGRGEQIWSERF